MPEQPNQGSSSSVSYSAANSITSATSQSGQTYTSSTADENALLISTSGSVTLTNPTVTKSGDSDGGDNCNFYGINSAVMAMGGGTVSITGGTVTATAKGANGVFSYGGNGGTNGAAGDGTTVYISGTTINTSGDNGGGIMTTGGGNTVARNLTITTTGNSSAPIRTDRGGGSVTVSGGSYTSSGLGSPAIYSTADITVENATLTSNKSEGVCIEGQNSVALTNCTLNASNTQTNGNAQFFDAVILYQSQSGDAASGTASFTMTNGTINNTSGHLFHVTNTAAVISLTNVTINDSGTGVLLSVCDDGWSGASNIATLTASEQTLDGDILVGDDSTLTLNLTNGTTFTGKVSGSITNNAGTTVSSDVGTVNVSLDTTSKWYLEEDTYISTFSGTAANVITSGYTLYVNNVALDGTTETDETDTSTGVSISNTASGTLITGTAYGDSISNNGERVTIQALGGNDSINNYNDNASISAGDGADLINNVDSDNVTIAAGTGNDTINNSGDTVRIVAGTGNDLIVNEGENVLFVYTSGDGNDTINALSTTSTLSITGAAYTSVQSGNDIVLGVGTGSITLSGAASLSTVNIIGTLSGGGSTDSGTLQGTSGDDSLEIVHEESSWVGGIRQTIYSAIYGLAGDDTLENVNEIYTYDGYTDYKNNVIMDGGTGNDLINNYGANSKLTGGDGNDYIVNHGDNVSISGGSGNDTIDNDGDNVSINAGDGDNSIDNSGTNVTLDALGNGNDSVYNTGNGLTINTGAGNNHVYNSGATLSITAGDGNDDIINRGSNVTINAGAGNNSIDAGGSNAIINTGAGNDSIDNNSNNSSISTGDGSDTIRNYGYNSSISTGAGNDSIHDSSDNSSISTGAGNDSIDVIGDNVTISGGAGDDYIRNIRGEGDNILIQYASGDGNDYITGFNATSTISIGGAAYTSLASGSNIILGVGTGSITLEGAASLSTVNIIGTLDGGGSTPADTGVTLNNTLDATMITGTAYADSITNSGDGVTIQALAGNDTIRDSGDSSSIDAGDGSNLIDISGKNEVILLKGRTTVAGFNTGFGDGSDTIYIKPENDPAGVEFLNDGLTFGNDTASLTLSDVKTTAKVNLFHENRDVLNKGVFIAAGDWYKVEDSDLTVGAGEEVYFVGTAATPKAGVDFSGINADLNLTIDTAYIDSEDYVPGTTMWINGVYSLKGGAGNTTITGSANSDTILAGTGATTINAAAGNDLISLSGSSSVIEYADGDGNDTVYGFSATDTLSVDNAYKIQVSGNDLIITVGDSKITLVDAASLSNPNIESTNEAVNMVEILLKRTAAGYPIASGILLNPEELIGEEPDNYATKEDWSITSADNLKLHGICYTPENSNDKWVVLVHGYGLKLESMYPFAAFYLANNYNVLMIDQRAAGKSEGVWLTMGAAESQDVALWTQEIARRNSNAKITLHGVSMGSATAMLAAARSDAVNVTSLVEDCGYTSAIKLFYLINNNYNLGVPDEVVAALDSVGHGMMGYYLHDAAPIDSITSAKMPTLFISGDDDGVVPVSMLSELYDASGAEVKEKFVVKGAGHAQAGLNDPVGYSNAVFRFVAEADGEGWDTENIFDNISLRGTKYNDTLANSGDHVTINAGAGDDIIILDAQSNVINYADGDGNDLITGFKANSSISIGGAAYSSVQSGNDVVLTIGDGKVTLTDAATLDTLNIIGTVEGGEGTSINNTASDTVLTGTPYDDTIISNGDRVSIGALGGNDTITFIGQDVTINAGTGNDTIRKGGFGNGKALIEYKAGDGNDYIYYPNSNDTLSIAGAAYSSIESDDDMILVVEDNFITLRGAADRNLNIIGEYTDTVKPGEYIINRLSNTTVTGTPLADTVSNYGNYVTIQALASQDSLRNYGNRVSISGNDGDDYIDNYSSLVTIEGDSGNDTINNISGNYVTVWTGAGNDSVNNGGNYVTIRADAGDDTIINSGDNVVFVCYARNGGNDLIQGFKANSTLSIVADIYDSGSFTSLRSGNDIVLTFVSGGNTVTLQGAATLSTVNIFGGGEVGISVNNTVNNTIVTGTDCADTLTNSGNYVTINAGKNNDTISNIGDNSVIDAGTGNDTVRNGGDNTSIFGGAGNDSIMSDGGGMTITGGKSDDTINSSRFGGVGTTYRYTSGDGNDFIQNFENEDTLVVIDSDFTTTRAHEAVVVVTVGEGQITLLGAEGTPNIVKESGGVNISNTASGTLVIGTDYDDTITNTGTRVTVQALDGNDYIANVVDSSVTTASLGNSISAGDGNDTIYNYHSYNPTLEGGAGDDSIVVSNGHLTYIDGGNGNDTILGQLADTATGGWRMGGHATILGGEGEDYIAPGYSNDSSIDGGTGNDTIRTNGANTTIDGGTGNNLIQITTTEEGVTGQYVVMNGKTTVENFGTGFGSLSDTVLIAGDAPAVDFKSDGLTFYSGDKSLTLSDVTTTARVNMYYAAWDVLTQNVYIADNEWHNVTDLERRTTDNLYYVGATASKNHGLNFNAVKGSLNMTLDTDYTADTDFYVNNVYSIRGGAGNTTITGSAKSDTILAGTGSTTINAGAGGDILSGNGKTTFNIDSGATTAVNGAAGDSLNVSNDSLIFMTDGTAYIVNGRLRRVSGNTVLESAEGDIISGDNVKNATVIDGVSTSLTSADRELVIGKRGASLKGYTLDKAFIRSEADAATIVDLINATDSSQLVLDSGTFYTKNQKPIVLEDYDTSRGTFVNIKTADGRKNIFGWSPLNGGIVDGNDIDKPQVIFGDAPNGNSTIRGGNKNDSIYAGAKDVVSLSGGHDELHINDETSQGVTVDMGDGSAQSRTRIVDGFDVTRDLLKIDSPENINARILDGSLQFIKGDSRVTFDELATFDDANGLQVQVDGRTYELRNDYDSGLANVDYFWTDTDGNYYITDSTFRIFDDGSTREYFIAEGSGKLTIDGFNFGRDNDKLNLNSIGGLKTYGDNLYIESGDSDVVEVVGGAGKTIDIKLDGTTYTAQLGKHLTYDLDAQYYGDLQGGTGCAISVAANFAHEEVAIYLNEEEEADGKIRYYGGVTKIDASAFTGWASLVGSEFNDKIIAAQGDTSLWGGEGGDDELFGTGSGNSFFYCLGNGDDKIYNAADGDSVNLVDITLDNITNSTISDGAVTLELSDGGRLTVMNSADVTFNLGDGTSWKADRQAREWQQQA